MRKEEDIHIKFNQVFNDYYNEIFHYVYNQVSNIEDAKDLTQEIFLKAYNNFPKYDELKASMRTWLYRIAHNHTVNFFRSYYKRNKVDLNQEYLNNIHDTNDILELILQEEDVKMLIGEMTKILSKKHFNIVSLYFFGELDYQGISEVLNIPLKTVRNVVSLSINKIKSRLEDINYERL